MFDREGESRILGRVRGTDGVFFWSPLLFSVGLSAAAIWLWLVDLPLLSEWTLLVRSALLGWILAWGPGQLWKRLLVVAVLAVLPLFALAIGANWLGADLVWLYPWTRSAVTLVAALVLGPVFACGGRLLRFSPIWGGSEQTWDNRWGVAEWLVLTGLLALSVSCLGLVVETAIVEKPAELFYASRSTGSFDRVGYWLMLLAQVGLFTLVELLLAVFAYLPVISFLIRGSLAGVSPRERLRQLLIYTAIWSLPLVLFFLATTNVRFALGTIVLGFTLVVPLAWFMGSFRDLTWRSTRTSS